MAFGFLFMGLFMVYGFVLIYLRDFSPDKEAWIAGDGNGPHFESRLAHVHGNLFAFLNIVIGFLLMRSAMPARQHRTVAWLALAKSYQPRMVLRAAIGYAECGGFYRSTCTLQPVSTQWPSLNSSDAARVGQPWWRPSCSPRRGLGPASCAVPRRRWLCHQRITTSNRRTDAPVLTMAQVMVEGSGGAFRR